MLPKIGSVVEHVRPDGLVRQALVMHHFEHDPNTGFPDAQCVNLTVLSDDEQDVTPHGRSLQILRSIRHESAEWVGEADKDPGYWRLPS